MAQSAPAAPSVDRAAWDVANRELLAKALGEFAHERLIQPIPAAGERNSGIGDEDARAYVVATDLERVEYRFRAKRRSLDHWVVAPTSIERRDGQSIRDPDIVQLILDLKNSLGIGPEALPLYLEELYGTVRARVERPPAAKLNAARLARTDFQAIECCMMDGHPCFVANGGRVGFSSADSHRFTPESDQSFALEWLAAHRSKAHFRAASPVGGPPFDYDEFVRQELGDETYGRFCKRLRGLGLAVEDYGFIPAHPWQWANKIAPQFAGELATGHLVYLGPGADQYRPQQSIRTLFNASRPERPYVKTALSILNMGFVRGLSPGYMASTPAINQWVSELVSSDRFLRERGFDILREFASIGYRHPQYSAGLPPTEARNKMLSALWRESPATKVDAGQQLATMAALLHRDADGEAYVAALIEHSGLSAAAWIRRYLDAYLAPLLHCFFHHEIAFMPHGENVILVLEDGVPVRVLVKDIAEETAVFCRHDRLPRAAKRLATSVSDDARALYILTDVFDCFFRFFASLLDDASVLPESDFWMLVATTLADYQDAHPELEDRFRRFDLFQTHFPRLCLNRLQLRNNRQLLDLGDPETSFLYAGSLPNPVARYRSRTHRRPVLRLGEKPARPEGIRP